MIVSTTQVISSQCAPFAVPRSNRVHRWQCLSLRAQFAASSLPAQTARFLSSTVLTAVSHADCALLSAAVSMLSRFSPPPSLTPSHCAHCCAARIVWWKRESCWRLYPSTLLQPAWPVVAPCPHQPLPQLISAAQRHKQTQTPRMIRSRRMPKKSHGDSALSHAALSHAAIH